MSNRRFDNLLEQMPKIAEVINSFESPEVQREVFTTLIRALDQEEPLKPLARSGLSALERLEREESVSVHDDISDGLDITPELSGGSIHSFIES